MKTKSKTTKANRKLSQDRIKRLEEIGFTWHSVNKDTAFEKRCSELIRFKEEFGHCKVPYTYPANPSLGHWCSSLRIVRNKIQKGKKPGTITLSQDRIDRLDEIGFDWHTYDKIFETRCRELIAFKEEFGHCDVPTKYTANRTLGTWCNHVRTAYKSIQKGVKPTANLTQDRMARLEEIGFNWRANAGAFDMKILELKAFKEDHGHCNIPARCSSNPSLGMWCSNLRSAHNKIQMGVKPTRHLPQHRIDQLNEIGFKWCQKNLSTRRKGIKSLSEANK